MKTDICFGYKILTVLGDSSVPIFVCLCFYGFICGVYVLCLFLFPPSFGALGGLCFVIKDFSWYLHLYVLVRLAGFSLQCLISEPYMHFQKSQTRCADNKRPERIKYIMLRYGETFTAATRL